MYLIIKAPLHIFAAFKMLSFHVFKAAHQYFYVAIFFSYQLSN